MNTSEGIWKNRNRRHHLCILKTNRAESLMMSGNNRNTKKKRLDWYQFVNTFSNEEQIYWSNVFMKSFKSVRKRIVETSVQQLIYGYMQDFRQTHQFVIGDNPVAAFDPTDGLLIDLDASCLHTSGQLLLCQSALNA